MKARLLNGMIILTSLCGYLEWGGNNATYLWQAELEIILRLFTNPLAAIHPFTLIPMLGQLLLVWSLFQKIPGKKITLIGVSCIGLLIIFILFIGLFSLNYKIVLSVMPFTATCILLIKRHLSFKK